MSDVNCEADLSAAYEGKDCQNKTRITPLPPVSYYEVGNSDFI